MRKGDKDLVILLTATITPNTWSKLKVTDPEVRKQQYKEALDFYIQKTDLKIVFAENSGDPLNDFPLLQHRIEYLSFKSEPTEPDRGKAYKELELIEYALQNSTFLKEARAVAKITGRLKVLNFNRLARNFLRLMKNQNSLVYANSYKPGNMDSRCFFFTSDFWPYQISIGQNISLRYNFELSLWDSVQQYNSIESKTFLAFYEPLRIEGISGFSGTPYRHNMLIHYARLIRNLAREILLKENLLKPFRCFRKGGHNG